MFNHTDPDPDYSENERAAYENGFTVGYAHQGYVTHRGEISEVELPDRFKDVEGVWRMAYQTGKDTYMVDIHWWHPNQD